MRGALGTHSEEKKCYGVWHGNHQVKARWKIPERRYENIIEIALREMAW